MNHTEKARALLKRMTLDEKAKLCSGAAQWRTKALPRLGITGITVSDGPHGLRKQTGKTDHLGINDSLPATAFPSACLSACSFDRALLHDMGAAIAEEGLEEDVSLVLGPGVDIKRSPLCGRNFEYFSEDPCLSGELAAAMIDGLQGKGIGACMKHYVAKNQETHCVTYNAVIDPRALHELYLAPYALAMEKVEPWAVMAGYNLVNGKNMSQNKPLLMDELRGRLGYSGLIVSDWGAVVDRVADLEAGLDLGMPFEGDYNDEAIAAAVRAGTLDEAVLDESVVHILSFILDAEAARRPGYRYSREAHHALARKAAAESIVLLKNDQSVLPLSKTARLAVIGAYADEPRIQGAGSSRIVPHEVDTLCTALEARSIAYRYVPGYSAADCEASEESLLKAELAARDADAAIVCIGTSRQGDSEGCDRWHLRIPESHVELLRRVKRRNPNTIVLLMGGGAMEMPWLADAKALLMLYLGGEAVMSAAADLLFGDVNPSGKLAESFPLKLEDCPSTAYFPGEGLTVPYAESVYVGYRYYDKVGAPVLFPFGFGLSYTQFSYSGLRLNVTEEGVAASVMVQNTGDREGAETVQFYVSACESSVFRPVWELRDFKKLRLKPGETAEAAVLLPRRAFAYFDAESDDFVVEAGPYRVRAASSSRDAGLTETVTLEGPAPRPCAAPAAYAAPSCPFRASEDDFAAIYGGPVPDVAYKPGDPYDLNSLLCDIDATAAGHELTEHMRRLVENNETNIGKRILPIMWESPIRSLPMFSKGKISHEDIREAIRNMNRELGL